MPEQLPDHPVRVAVLWYVGAVLVFFMGGIYVLRLQEFGEYLFVGAINLPASLVVFPVSETILGRTPDALWVVQAVCLALNTALLAGIVAVVARKRRAAGN